MDLDERLERERTGALVQGRQLVVLERGHDQQHGVGAGDARLVQLVGVEDEVLAQDRQLAGRAGDAQILQRALEMRSLREHGQRARPPALIRAHDALDVRALAQRPRRGGAPLELGDHAHAWLGEGTPQRTLRARAGVRAAPASCGQRLERKRALAVRELLARALQDAREQRRPPRAHEGASAGARATLACT